MVSVFLLKNCFVFFEFGCAIWLWHVVILIPNQGSNLWPLHRKHGLKHFCFCWSIVDLRYCISFRYISIVTQSFLKFFLLPFFKEDNAFLTINRNLRVGKRTRLVVQQLRIWHPRQETQERACSRAWEPQLLSPHATTTEACTPRAHAPQQEKSPQWLGNQDSTCHRATKPLHHNYWVHTPKPMLCNEKVHCNEKPMHGNKE